MPRLTPDANAPTPYYVHGSVDIDGEAAIAAGVILTAAPGCRLVVSSGACLGAGVIIDVHQGDLVIEPEASVGSDVLIVGRGRIGAQTCIGAGSTLINPQLPPRSVIASRSRVGDPSRSLDSLEETPEETSGKASPDPVVPSAEAPTALPASPDPSPSEPSSPSSSNGSSPIQGEASSNGNGNNSNGNGSSNGNGNGRALVHGRDQVDQLLNTLFPHRQPLGVSPPSRSE